MLGSLGGFDNFDQYVQSSTSTELAFPAIPVTAVVKNPERIFVQAHPDNTANIFIGKTGVLTNGSVGALVLAPGSDCMLPFNEDKILFHISTGTQKLFITYLGGGHN